MAGKTLLPALLCALVGGLAPAARAADIDGAPINYAKAPADNAVARLQRRLDSGQAQLAYDDRFGYLPSLLKELRVPVSSQMLVFSKTSFQRHRISPKTPRAVYFADDVYVGSCQNSDLLELTAVDPNLGAVFYSFTQKPGERPRFTRQDDTCLICHGSSQNQGLPGHLVRSVFADAGGLPVLSAGTYRVDHCSPLTERWGGWYVTGTSGHQRHLGNLIVRDRDVQPERIDNAAGVNVTSLAGRVNTARYLSPHSDIVALMVLEHQAEVQNKLTRANFLTRQALYDEAAINKALGRPADYRSELTTSRIKNAGEPLVKYLLLSGETALTGPVRGTSGFAEEFARRGPRDRRGRSLRALDLRRRLFKYPCSYVIYSAAFDALPKEVKDYVWRRLWDVLSGQDAGKDFAHLSAADRRAIREIVRDTKPQRPDYWR
jgi:hypothetical protein